MSKDFENLVAITGLGGLHQLIANRTNGLIVEQVGTGKRHFASSRKHEFTPLGSIGIYTNNNETVELVKVFRTMKASEADHPIPEKQADPDALRAYFEIILPDYDRDQVSVSDMRKVVKWFRIVDEHNLIPEEETETDTEENSEEEE
ncbi:MAG: DUF5606 domain-containing protein [Saprospiraceae bacterium]|jgi:hypothetical protein